jgi:hypothetical protein
MPASRPARPLHRPSGVSFGDGGNQYQQGDRRINKTDGRTENKSVQRDSTRSAVQPAVKKDTSDAVRTNASVKVNAPVKNNAPLMPSAPATSVVTGNRQTDSRSCRPAEKPPVNVSEKDLKTLRRPHMRIVGGPPPESIDASRPARPAPGAITAPAARAVPSGMNDTANQKEEKAPALKTILGRIFKK